MPADIKEYIRTGRRAMNLLTKRGKWSAAPLNPSEPRLVTFVAGPFEIVGKQGGSGGGGTMFDVVYAGRVCLQGRARINWLTEDTSFDLSLTELSEAARSELAALYDAQLPEGVKI